MKKYYFLIIVALILGLVLTGCSLLSNISQVPATEQSGVSSIVKNGPPPGSICVNFESTNLSEGGFVEGEGTVDPLLNIELENTSKSLILLYAGTSLPEYTAYNTAPAPSIRNGCLNGDYGFGCPVLDSGDNVNLTTALENGDKIVFTFPAGVTVSYFSIMMFDYGDWYPLDGTVHKVKLTGNDGSIAEYLGPSSASNPGYDACAGVGQQKLEISGSGIIEVTLEFVSGIDPGVGFDDICFTPEPKECSTYLQAGNPKNGENDVGDVMVEYIPGNDYLTVTYTTDEPWLMNEIHFHAASSEPDSTWPVTKVGNPIPGHFDWVFEGLEGDERTGKTFTILIPEEVTCGELYFAAHAAVEKIIEPAPRYPSAVVSFNQGLRKDGTAVTEGRSNTLQGLVYEANNVETDFFSLGFGGWIIVEFDCPIPNGEGNDLRIIEDTWGTYPLETAEVYASQDGSTWVPLGEANNTLRETGDNFHSFSAFDLGNLEWAKYIKVVDTTNPALHGSTADGFDLNAVEALQDCIQEETAWGDGLGFPGAKNWSMYFGCLDLVPCPF